MVKNYKLLKFKDKKIMKVKEAKVNREEINN
jgi:hypothetical protein